MHWIHSLHSFIKSLEQMTNFLKKRRTIVNKTSKILAVMFAMGWVMTSGLHAEGVSDVWAHHIQTWNARDLNGLTSDYTEDSIVIVNNHVFKGTTAIRSAFEQLFNLFDHGENRIDTPTLVDRVVYITWHFTHENKSAFDGSDTFVIENGKIAIQTIASALYDAYPIQNR